MNFSQSNSCSSLPLHPVGDLAIAPRPTPDYPVPLQPARGCSEPGPC
eukprot:CAMPEP_0204355538 /NCGR_PEP_ID=MMETSP0469-20131031/34218_1 /ASSEMBLY_ACC=CAM_ASM_000384 /TAXON_ID=2969 /ORGANISM="Oxyrrhis marina" /LENGTH=46 /DNA_ID= /DNA_START= /DNA_END= /DNA_ORIENTATION=